MWFMPGNPSSSPFSSLRWNPLWKYWKRSRFPTGSDAIGNQVLRCGELRGAVENFGGVAGQNLRAD